MVGENILSVNDIYLFLLTAFGWCISMFCLLQLPMWAIYAILKQNEKSWRKKIANAFRPNAEWGPKDPEICEKFLIAFYFVFFTFL